MWKKKIGVLLILTMITGLFAGCGGQQQAVQTIPAQGGGDSIADQEKDQPEFAARPLFLVERAEHRAGKTHEIDDDCGTFTQQRIVDDPQNAADHLQGQDPFPASALQGGKGDDY